MTEWDKQIWWPTTFKFGFQKKIFLRFSESGGVLAFSNSTRCPIQTLTSIWILFSTVKIIWREKKTGLFWRQNPRVGCNSKKTHTLYNKGLYGILLFKDGISFKFRRSYFSYYIMVPNHSCGEPKLLRLFYGNLVLGRVLFAVPY